MWWWFCAILACTDGTWGEDCSMQCQCREASTRCDPATGCTRCPDGYQGTVHVHVHVHCSGLILVIKILHFKLRTSASNFTLKLRCKFCAYHRFWQLYGGHRRMWRQQRNGSVRRDVNGWLHEPAGLVRVRMRRWLLVPQPWSVPRYMTSIWMCIQKQIYDKYQCS